MSWVCRTQWASGIRSASLPTATSRTSSAAVRRSSSTAMRRCLRPGATSRRRSRASPPAIRLHLWVSVHGCAERLGGHLQAAQRSLCTDPCLQCLLRAPGGPAARHCSQPGDFGFKVPTSKGPAEKQEKLAAEFANGCLALMAIIGGALCGLGALLTNRPAPQPASRLPLQGAHVSGLPRSWTSWQPSWQMAAWP